MRRALTLATATVALALTVSLASAGMVVVRDAGGKPRIVNTEGMVDVPMVEAMDGKEPANCPQGSYFMAREEANNRDVFVECVSHARYIASDQPSMAAGAPEGSSDLVQDGEWDPSPNRD